MSNAGGVDYGNVDSRRAYPLDGRTTWVESMHTGSGHVVGKDNRVLGPGEYSPGLPTLLLSILPSGARGSRGIVDHFTLQVHAEYEDAWQCQQSYEQEEHEPGGSWERSVLR